MDKYEKAAIDHDHAEWERLKDYLRKVDPDGEAQFAGRSVIDWATDFISRDLNHSG